DVSESGNDNFKDDLLSAFESDESTSTAIPDDTEQHDHDDDIESIFGESNGVDINELHDDDNPDEQIVTPDNSESNPVEEEPEELSVLNNDEPDDDLESILENEENTDNLFATNMLHEEDIAESDNNLESRNNEEENNNHEVLLDENIIQKDEDSDDFSSLFSNENNTNAEDLFDELELSKKTEDSETDEDIDIEALFAESMKKDSNK
ncbi:MAG: hypothetical protein HON94_09650, partial [Methylococcales bacterium]|nr:hypothetical protein [Methylococcales bacterium]